VRGYLGLLVALLLLGVTTPVQAAISLNQLYDTYVCSSYPEVEILDQAEIRLQRFPYLDNGRSSMVEYGELEYYGSGVLGLVNCTPARDGYASLVFFGADGRSRIIHHALPLRVHQPVTLSGWLPPGVGGVMLLLLWDSLPDQEALIGLAVDPNSGLPAIGGVREADWFSRGRPSAYAEPWNDLFRPDFGKAEPVGQADWPWCSARLTAGDQTITKDCAVDFNGMTGLAIDEYGAYGQWRLDWASELTLHCELPSSEDWSAVEMWLYGAAPQIAQAPDLSMLELEINGWPVRFSRWQLVDQVDTQHIAMDLSQYLHGGSNRIRMRLSSFAGSEWLIHGIEVWMY